MNASSKATKSSLLCNWPLKFIEKIRPSVDSLLTFVKRVISEFLYRKFVYHPIFQLQVKDLEKYEGALGNPSEFFIKQKAVYSAFDAEGIPTHIADGKELSKARKVMEFFLCL